MTARGFCTCTRDFPERRSFHPPEHATWHFLCDKPVQMWPDLPPANTVPGMCARGDHSLCLTCPEVASRIVPTGTGWPVK